MSPWGKEIRVSGTRSCTIGMEDSMLRPIAASNARTELFSLLSGINADHEPVLITSKNGNGVLVAEEDWRGIEETLYLFSVPGMREALLEARAEPVEGMARLEDL